MWQPTLGDANDEVEPPILIIFYGSVWVAAPHGVDCETRPGCTVEVFQDDDEDQGETHVGSLVVNQNLTWLMVPTTNLVSGRYVTATLTDLQGNTSTFYASSAPY